MVRMISLGVVWASVLVAGCVDPDESDEFYATENDDPKNEDNLTEEEITQLVAGKVESVNVMAPLQLTYAWEWNNFKNQLDIARDMGVDAVSVDIWWGKVERNGDNQFDWSYYDGIVHDIEARGLHWVPIMSFHQCGGNVGDTCDTPIPDWIWDHYRTQGITPQDMQYQSEQGNYSGEYVSLWADEYVVEEYIEFMEAFEDHFGDKAYMTDEINVSGGTAGELRYPSYNGHDWNTGYPTRGALQSYGRLAREDFRAFALGKYGDLNGVNNAWGSSLSNADQINPPDDVDGYFSRNDHTDSQYGRDFHDWYNGALIGHGKRMIDAAIYAFDGDFRGVDLGIKIPGVHWRIGSSSQPRLAELTAGLIPSSEDWWSSSSGHGYNRIVGTVAAYNNSGRHVVLHFTCLEMGNENAYPAYSQAENLVFWVADAAQSQGVAIKGENALAGGVMSHEGWNNIENATTWASYSGLTVLRIDNVTWNGTGRDRMTQYIQRYK